ncbi:MAG: ferredoxin, partial [Sphingobacterium sp.]
DKPYTDYMEESEDGVEDIANWIVSNGLDLYVSVIKNPKKIPYSVNEFTNQILYGIADEVCTEKYGESTGIY